MKEIGGEFWNVPVTKSRNTLFPSNTKWFLSGRSALKAIIKELRGIETVAMPSWCCDSIIKPFIDAGISVNFYPIHYKNGFVQDITYDCDALFVMDFFGYTSNELDLSNYNGVVIRDVTHSLFSASYFDADYYFGSLRKWSGFWTGGFAWGKSIKDTIHADPVYEKLRCSAMEEKASYIASPNTHNKGFLSLYEEAENILDNCSIVSAAHRDIELASFLDVDFIRNRRRTNAMVLMKAFQENLIFHDLDQKECPMFVPIIVSADKRDELRKYLIKKSIYCPVHWPLSSYHKLNEKDKRIYSTELSLVCDQRYTTEDMNRIVETINDFLWEE